MCFLLNAGLAPRPIGGPRRIAASRIVATAPGRQVSGLRVVALACLVAMGCDSTVPITARRFALRRVPTCPSPDTYPLRGGNSADDTACVRLGATDAIAPRASAFSHVVAGAPRGGDGSASRPFGSIAEALASSPEVGALSLSPGLHAVDGLVLTRDLAIEGQGRGSTVISGSRSFPLITVRGARVALSSLSVRSSAGTSQAGPLVRLEGATVALHDVLLTGGEDGIESYDSSVEGTRLTVERPRNRGVYVERGSLSLSDFVVRQAGGQGVRVVSGHFELHRGAIVGSGRHGFVATGDAPRRDVASACARSDEGDATDCVVSVSAVENHVAGFFFEGRRSVELRSALASGTRLGAVDGGFAGDGLVAHRTRVRLTSAAEGTGLRGVGCAAIDNARVGVLVQGNDAVADLRGILVAVNRGGGVVVTDGATLTGIRDSLLEGNQVGGLLLTPGVTAGVVQCNGIYDNQLGAVATTIGEIVLGDGVHLNGVRGEVSMVENEVSGSARFGLLVNGASVTGRSNTGSGNLHGVGVYSSGSLRGDFLDLLGTSATPTVPPSVLRGL